MYRRPLSWAVLLACLLLVETGYLLISPATAATDAVTLTAASPVPITSAAPWREITGTIVAGQPISYTFSGNANQVATIDAVMPITQSMRGRVTLKPLSTGAHIEDAVYGQSYEDFNQINTSFSDNLANLTAALPFTDTYVIEIAPSTTFTAPFSLRFNLIDPASSILVDDDLTSCPAAPTGFVRAAVRAVQMGGTIVLCPGEYHEYRWPIFSQPDVTLEASQYNQARIIGYDHSTLRIGHADHNPVNVTVRGVALENRAGGDVIQLFENSHGFTLRDCLVDSGHSQPNGVASHTGAPHNDITIMDCEFRLDRAVAGDIQGVSIVGDRAEIVGNRFNVLPGYYMDTAIVVTGNDAQIRGNVFGQDSGTANVFTGALVGGDRAVIEDNHIRSFGTGIRVTSGGIGPADRVESVTLSENVFGSNTTANGGVSDGIDVSGVRNALIERNVFTGYPNLSRNIRLNRSGGVIINNRLTIHRYDSIMLSWNTIPSDNNPFHDLLVANNTVLHESSYVSGNSVIVNYPTSITTTLPISVVNNIFSAPVPSTSQPNFCGLHFDVPVRYADYNLIDGHGAPYCDQAVAGTNDILAEPGFDDGQFHLATTSPAIDAGLTLPQVPTDFEGETRPKNRAYDIGADERPVPANLAVIKRGPKYGFTDWPIPYEMVVTNHGPGAATNVLFEDIYALNLVSSESSGTTCSQAQPTQCTFESIDAGESVTVTVTLSSTATGVFTNTATVFGAEIDPSQANNLDRVATSVAQAPSGPFDIWPTAMEVTQGIQNLANDVPLVRGKPTVVRVYLQSDGETIPNITAVLHGRDAGGDPLPGSPLAPLTRYEIVTVTSDDPDRAELDESIIFELPAEWTRLAATLTAEVNPTFSGMETNASNNVISFAPELLSLPRICIRTYRVWAKLESGDDGPLLPWDYLENDPDRMLPTALGQLPTRDILIYPMNRVLEKSTPFDFGQGPEGFDLDNGGVPVWLLIKLWVIDQLSNDPDGCDQEHARTHYMGMIHETAAWGRGGFADGFIANDQLLVQFDTGGDSINDPWGGETLAHELGHNYGRWHVRCGPVSGFEPRDRQYPYDRCMFAPDTSTDTYFGTDLAGLSSPDVSLDVIPPVEPTRNVTGTIEYSLGDLMSYANDTWVSDWNWRKIGLRLCGQAFVIVECLDWGYPPATSGTAAWAESSAPSFLPAAPLTVTYPYTGDILLISGHISLTAQISGTGSLSETYRLESVRRLPQSVMPGAKLDSLWQQQNELTAGGSDYALRLLDGSDGVLHTQPFTATAVFDGNGVAFFGLVAPYITNTERVEIAFQSSPVLSRTASANAPSVTVLTPNGGETFTDTLTVSWDGQDLDGDELTYLVQYSADDGLTWQVLQVDLYTTTLRIETIDLPGSAGQGRVRVIASDGFNTGQDGSDASFSLALHAPRVHIKRPSAGATFETGQLIVLSGQALDAEEGVLPSDALVWTVDGMGEVGSGEDALIPGLATGTYTVTLTATDDAGMVSHDTVAIEVTPKATPPAADLRIYLPTIIHQ